MAAAFAKRASAKGIRMNLLNEILKEHSKKQTTKVVKWVGEDAKRFEELMNLFLKEGGVVTQRASAMVGYCGVEQSQLLKPWNKKLLDYMEVQGTHPAVRRNILRIYQFVPVPAKFQGRLVDTCFRFLTSKDEPIAVKAFAMTILKKIAKENPDLKQEVKMVVEELLPYASPGIKARAKCLFRELQ